MASTIYVQVDPDTIDDEQQAWQFIQVGDDGDWSHVREGKAGKAWHHAEALARAAFVAELTGATLVENEYVKPARVRAETAKPQAAPKPANLCRHCGDVIPSTGKRGRPRVVHAECAEAYQAAQEQAAAA